MNLSFDSRLTSTVCPAVVLFSLVIPPVPSVAADRDAAQDSQRLVTQALEAVVKGDQEAAKTLLQKAIDVSPESALARWYRGEVQIGDHWKAIDDVPTAFKNDAQLAQYRKLRAKAMPTVRDQLALAEWCQEQRLSDEARSHFTKVLELERNHPAAIAGLDLAMHEGELLGREEIARRQVEAAASETALRRWKPVLTALRGGMLRGEPSAIRELRAIRHPSAIPALEAVFGRGKAPGLEMVGLLDRMPQQEATEALVRQAVGNSSADVRAAAVGALKKRRPHNYLPILISVLRNPVTTDFEIVVEGNTVRYRYTQALAERTTDRLRIEDVGLDLTVPNRYYNFFLRDALNKTLIAAANNERQLVQLNREAELQNAKIFPLLAATTGAEVQSSASAWWDWWNRYNELHVEERTVIAQQFHYSYDIPYEVPEEPYPVVLPPPPRVSSCFAAGTPVWTTTGPVAIDELQIGDRVLSQDVDTGELAYKPVLNKTIRPPAPMFRIRVAGESILTTKGHPFWVVNEGWKMAKELSVGSRLFAIGATPSVASVEPERAASSYNLVVADHNNYFVGNNRILVHDNSMRKPTIALIPGLHEQATE